MIMVEVQVPAVGRRYDFELEESVPVELLISEMAEVFCQKEHLQMGHAAGTLNLYRKSTSTRLNRSGTLQQNGICGGQQLILV